MAARETDWEESVRQTQKGLMRLILRRDRLLAFICRAGKQHQVAPVAYRYFQLVPNG